MKKRQRPAFSSTSLGTGPSTRFGAECARAGGGCRPLAGAVADHRRHRVYAGSLDGNALLDDQRAIVANRQIQSLSDALSPPRDTPVAGRPLVNPAFAINYATSGLDAAGFRVVNVALHIAAAPPPFGLVRRTIVARPIRLRTAICRRPPSAHCPRRYGWCTRCRPRRSSICRSAPS